MAYDYDLFVIGAGSGGVRAARLAAMSGAKVAVAEADRVGGTCVIRGCVPKKFMVYASEFSHAFEDARGFGWDVGEPHFDWKRFLARKDDEIARLSGVYATNLQKAGADLIHAKATFIDAHTIDLGDKGKVTADEMEKRGVRIILGSQHERIEKTDAGLLNHLTHGQQSCTFDQVMLAVGRRAATDDLGLDAAGVSLNEDGTVKVDDYSQTSQPNIWAIGDVTGRINLTPVAIREAVAFAETVFHDRPTKYDHDAVPTAVFSQPPVGTVGLTEADARKSLGQVDIYQARFRPMKVTFQGRQERTFMKLVVCCKTDKVVGVHIVGADAPEMIQLAAIAVKMGVTKAQWDSTTA